MIPSKAPDCPSLRQGRRRDYSNSPYVVPVIPHSLHVSHVCSIAVLPLRTRI